MINNTNNISKFKTIKELKEFRDVTKQLAKDLDDYIALDLKGWNGGEVGVLMREKETSLNKEIENMIKILTNKNIVKVDNDKNNKDYTPKFFKKEIKEESEKLIEDINNTSKEIKEIKNYIEETKLELSEVDIGYKLPKTKIDNSVSMEGFSPNDIALNIRPWYGKHKERKDE